MTGSRLHRAIFLTFASLLVSVSVLAGAPKREFRGAWIQAVNGQWLGLTGAQMRQTLSDQLDSLESCGINAILFQVRCEGDALYKSDLEPWSRYLTGKQGQAPDDDWDPLQFMVEQCHRRGMEIHAWINPFRAKTANTTEFAPNHQTVLHPERSIPYGDLVIFNPALKENRDFICKVAADIVTRYDIDGFHMDDYFYPYPRTGEFEDASFFKNDSRGFDNRDDWRRDNVNLCIEQLYKTIKSIKPWVKFGISPFGIYRNASVDYPDGSATSGFQNYSGLYADILLWIEKEWMDYCLPQVYWNVGAKSSDHEILARWWAEHAGNVPMYIGQDVERTVSGKDPKNPKQNQERYKMNLQRSIPQLQGSCQWYAKAVVDNPSNYRTVLAKEYYNYPALQPLSKGIPQDVPGKVRKPMVVTTKDGPVLFWTAPKSKTDAARAHKYVVYRFEKGEKIDIEDPSHIVSITDHTFYPLSSEAKGSSCEYVVTALSRVQVESAPVRCKVKL